MAAITLTHLWSPNSRRAAYRQWQAEEANLIASRQLLTREYLAAQKLAVQLHLDERQGILREVRLLLDHPLTSENLKTKHRLQQAFAIQGRGFWPRLPAALEVELAQYAAILKRIGRRHQEAAAKLRLTQKILGTFAADPDFYRAHFFRLAVTSPESAALVFLLRRRRQATRRKYMPVFQ